MKYLTLAFILLGYEPFSVRIEFDLLRSECEDLTFLTVFKLVYFV